jgi:hypothetical protein
LTAYARQAVIPYLPYSKYSQQPGEQRFLLTHPLESGPAFHLELSAESETLYHVWVEALESGEVVQSLAYTQTLSAGELQSSSILLFEMDGRLSLEASAPQAAPLYTLPGEVLLRSRTGSAVQSALVIDNLGQPTLEGIRLEIENMLGQAGEPLPEGALALGAVPTSLEGGDQVEISLTADLSGVSPGSYLGRLTLYSENGGVRLIPLSLVVDAHRIYFGMVFTAVYQ